MRQVRLISLVLVSSLLVAGCGGEEKPAEPSAEEQVRAAAQRLADERDGQVICSQLVTAGFLEAWYDGDRAQCAETLSEDGDEQLGRQRVETVEVAGDRATVGVVHVGGLADGNGGHLRFAREGTAWKLDDYEDDFVRAMFTVSVAGAATSDGNGALTYPPLRKCMEGQVDQMAAAKVRGFMVAAVREQPAAARFLVRLMRRCPREAAHYVADAIVDGLVEDGDHTAAYERCMRRDLTGMLWLTGLHRYALKGKAFEIGTLALSTIAKQSHKQCAPKDR